MSSHRRNYQCFQCCGGEAPTCLLSPSSITPAGSPGSTPMASWPIMSLWRNATFALSIDIPKLWKRHEHHQRHSKRLVLVKNSDPSSRKTIALHRRSLHSFGLFIEEVSELMQYHVRKLYTLDGRKIDNVQSLMQSPSVLVCMGREPSHPSVVENFEKTSYDKLPDLHSHSSGCNGGLSTKQSANSQLESDNRSTGHSVTSDKSLPDGTDSPDKVDSCPHTGPHTGRHWWWDERG
ncbi:hypothetical protein KUCAC02_020258 [Chaenocephalus aceratus]|uniref:Uncharacterized protein n=1 Tax=Chaenocephalus aceratus TaxID=36190 RepID=A0ACB9VS87_CHAAC|nr:hypothetical protein KUCAC02_020258 [Chaenocephalus aceratus]